MRGAQQQVELATQEVLPLVSIVTPCYNMAGYVGETVQSVLDQDYPRIEYVVMDGGSTDGTLEILEKYKGRLSCHSGPDGGAADAINQGFRRCQGEIFTFLNADDYYLPGAVTTAVRHLMEHPEAGVVYGEASWVDEKGLAIGDYPTRPFDPERLRQECFICQPAAFMRRSAFESVGMMDAEWRLTFDYDLWIRMARRHRMLKVDERLAASRMHRESISFGSRRRVLEETMRLLQRHYAYIPFQRVHSYCSYLLDRRDQFFEPLRPSFLKYALSLPAGLFYNRRHPWRYLKEWGSVMSVEGLRRRLAPRSRDD